jgi:cell division topological specificity factor
MPGFLERLFGRRDKQSARKAAERLRFVLVTDRSNISPQQLQSMQKEIIEVIKKYCRIDENAVEMKLEQRERDNYLVADIPLARDSSNPAEEPGSIAFSLQTSSSGTSPAPASSDENDKKD